MEQVDVLVCGAGPVGLLIAYCLARYGLSTYIVEQHERAKQMMYGRAAMIAPRCLEMLEQLDLVDALTQMGFIVRGQVHYKNGERIEATRYASSNITDTFYDYLLLVRQKHTEEVFREAYTKSSGKSVHYGVKLLNYHIDEGPNDYWVLNTLESRDGAHISVKSRFIVGADGGRSTVRELARIQFQGDKTNHHFIRIDGIVKTNMPEARGGLCGIESSSHGSVLWACLDHGRTRIGFAFPEKLWKEIGANITKEDVIREAKKALQPFTLEFESVDWWTAYSVGQRLASNYRARDRVLISGDAAHTHSSAAAQGMNTGLHDAVNLSWKLSGHIKGWFTERVLDSYADERRGIALKIIEQDSVVALLTAGEVPKQYQNDPYFDPSEALSVIYKSNQALFSGIGVGYSQDGYTIVDGANTPTFNVSPGERAPDVLVQRPGMRIPIRLYTLFKNVGKFTIILFCGDPGKTSTSLKTWRDYIDGPKSYTRYPVDLFQHLSIIDDKNYYGSVGEKLGIDPFGHAFYDVDGSAHCRYGVTDSNAAVLILRPDGTIGIVCRLTDGHAVSRYFARILTVKKNVAPEAAREDHQKLTGGAGEVDIQTSSGRAEVEGAT